MKIVIVVPYLKSIGGAARYSWELSEHLANKGDSVIVTSLYADRKLFPPKETIQVVDLADETCLPQTIKYWLSLRKIRKNLNSLIRTESPDVIIFINWPTSMWADNYGRIPVIFSPLDIQILYSDTYTKNLSVSMYWLWKILRYFVRIYEKKKWKHFDHIIASSKYTANHISQIYHVNSTVIYLGAKKIFFEKNNFESKQRAIFCLGDIKARHADFLIEAANRLSKKRNDFKIWIAGNKGEHEQELRNLVEKYNLKETVEFFGWVSDSKLSSLYSESLVFTHLVKDAPFGMQVTEAMAAGTPVISWKPGGPEESIQDGETGFLIPQFNNEVLIKHIELFLDNPDLSIKMGKKARNRAHDYFQSSDIYEQIRTLMKNSISELK